MEGQPMVKWMMYDNLKMIKYKTNDVFWLILNYVYYQED